MTSKTRPHPKTRVIRYAFEGDFTENVDLVLRKALADGIITQYDDGRNHWPWFCAKAGPETRALRDKIVAMGGRVVRDR